jgi:hypothetical protein
MIGIQESFTKSKEINLGISNSHLCLVSQIESSFAVVLKMYLMGEKLMAL